MLAILQGGGYAYLLNNLSADVQALKTGESVIDRFTYTVSDGTQSAHGELAVTVQGRDRKVGRFRRFAKRCRCHCLVRLERGAAAPAATTFNAGTDDRQVMHGQGCDIGAAALTLRPLNTTSTVPMAGRQFVSTTLVTRRRFRVRTLLEKFLINSRPKRR